MPLLKSLQRGIRALFLSDADAKKAEQLGLFDAPVMVSGYVNSKGTFVGTHRSTRKKAVHSAEKPPAQHPLERAQVGPGSIVSWSKGDQPISGRVTDGPTTDGIVQVTVTDSKNPAMKVGQHTIQHVDNITVVVANEPAPAHAQSGLDFEADPPEPAPVSEPGAEVVQNHTVTPYDQFGAAYDATPAQRRADNAAALKLLNEKENNEFTDDDRRVLAKYSGAGGIGDSLNEYYTRQDVAEAMWGVVARLGIPGSSVLEPSCGTGMFMHTAPGGIAVSGVELDPISARIAQVVHPTHDVVLAPFEVAANNGIIYDAVIGNPPFGPRGALIAQDKKSIPRAEQYFVDTALDKTREGGLVALVVPTGVLDASSARKLRRIWCCKGQFLGAIRMPNTAFKHSQTEVVTDVVFFRRRAPDAAQALQTLDDEQLKSLNILDEEFIDGGYFAGRGAQNVMGTMEQGWRAKAGMGEDITVTGSMDGVAGAIAGFEPEAAKPVIMDAIEAALAGDDKALARARRAALKPVYDVAKVGDIRVIDGVRYVLQGHPPRWHRTEDVDGAPPEPEHVAAARGIGKQIAAFAAGQPGVGSGDIIAALEDHIERYGIPRKSAEFKAAAEHDPDLLRVMAAVRADGSFSDLLTGRAPTEEAPTLEAAAQRLSEAGDGFTADELVSAYPDIDKETALDHLYASNLFALLPGAGEPRFITMAQYLTGELWPKLDEAQAQLAQSPDAAIKAKLELQAERLEETIAPKSLDDVELGLNYAWIPLDVIDEFCNHQRAEYLVGSPAAASWSKPYKITFEGAIYRVEGSGGPNASLLDKYLNRTGVREEDWPLVHALNEQFAEWLLGSDQRQRVEDIYNHTYRGFVQPKFSSEPIAVPGLTTEMSVNDYHWAGLRWALARKKGICAADVGLGKTPRALILAKLLKVHQQAKKPMIVVPKSVLANWAAEAEQWFPGSKVMIIGEKYTKGKDGKLKALPETAAERNQKYHDLSQNDYDFILTSQPAWNELDIDPITKSQYSDDEFWTQRAEALGNAGDKRRRTIKENFEQAMAKRDFDKRTDVIYFNELGIDAVIADEAHAYKNLFSAKNRFGESPKFLGGSGESARAIDTMFKTRWIREHNDGNNVYFLTATPARNSPLEIYSMLQHIAPEAFLRMGIRNSEEFIDRFCEFTKDTFLDTNGAIGEALITSGFKNLDELREVMYRWMDRQTAKDVGLKMPKAEPVEHLIDMNADQQKAYAQLREAAKKGSKENADSHIFSIMDRMGKVALDMKLYEPNYKGEESPKYAAVAKVAAQYKDDGGQIIFCEAVDSHERIKAGLVTAGFKPGEIAIINGQTAKTSLARQKVSDDFNGGRLKVVIGNKTMEEGMNLQKRTSDMHDMDIPWEPAALQQRHGRGVRQGNKLEGVRLHRYLARGSFDGYRYQTMSAKKDWMDQLYGTATRTENLAAQMKPSRDEMLIMLSADPEAERAKYAANKGAALELHRAERRKAGGAGFERFRQLHRSYTALVDKQSRTAVKLKRSMTDAKTRLQADEYFEAKEALDAPDKILVDPSTGDSFKAGHGVEITCEKGAPINYPEGSHKFVMASVDPAARTIALRPYGQFAGTITVKPHGIAGHSKHFEVDHEAEEADATANELGNIVGAAAKHATTGSANPDKVKADVAEAVDRVVKLASGASKDWHKTSAGRGRVWAMLADAIKQAAPAATDAALQKITDTAELSLALREHAIAGAELEDPVHLVGLPEAAILDNMPTILRHMHTVHAAYGGGNLGDNVPVIGAGGEAEGKKSFEYRKNLGTTERFMLPIESDKKAAQQAWKKWQGNRNFSIAYRSSGRRGHSYSQSDRMPGVEIKYGNRYGDITENPMGRNVTKLFGADWEVPARRELEAETVAAAAAKTTFREKVTAWLPATSAAPYSRYLKWPGKALHDLAAQAKQEGILDKLAANHMAETPHIFEGDKQWSGGTTVAAALRDAATRAGERELAEELGQHPQVALVQRQDYRSY